MGGTDYAAGAGHCLLLLLWRLLAAGLAAAAFSVHAAGAVELILSDDTRAYAEAALTLRRELGDGIPASQVLASSLEGQSSEGESELVVALGTRALIVALAARAAPIVAALVPRAAFEVAVRSAPQARAQRPVTAVYLDQPFARQFDLIRLVVPERRRIGVLISPDREDNLGQLQALARARNLEVVGRTVASPQAIYPALAHLLAQTDLILAVPDTAIYNSGTIHNILLTTYRARQPLFGFSAAYVRAGALAAVYSTPQQVARQAAAIVLNAIAGGALPPPAYASAFSVDVNHTVAHSLGLTVEDDLVIEAKLQALERGP